MNAGREETRGRRERRRGMTLIEVLVSMTLLAVVGSLTYSGFNQTSKNKRTVERQLDQVQSIRAALERMSRELSMAFLSAHANPNQGLMVSQTLFRGDSAAGGSRVDFTSVSHQRMYRNARESDQNELSYFVTDAPDLEGKVLARRVQTRIDADPEEGGRVEILLEGVSGLELSYLDPTTNEWLDRWDSQDFNAQPNRLPAQVKILLTVADPLEPDEERIFGTRSVLGMRWATWHAEYR